MILENYDRAIVDKIITLHLESYGANELSSILGRAYLEIYYNNLLFLKKGFISYFIEEDTIVCFALVFSDYVGFQKHFRKKYKWWIAFMLWNKGCSIKNVLKTLFINTHKRKIKNTSYPETHLGHLALAPMLQGTKDGKTILYSVFDVAFERAKIILKAKGIWGCWNVENVKLQKVLKKYGMKEVETINNIAIYEVLFKDKE